MATIFSCDAICSSASGLKIHQSLRSPCSAASVIQHDAPCLVQQRTENGMRANLQQNGAFGQALSSALEQHLIAEAVHLQPHPVQFD